MRLALRLLLLALCCALGPAFAADGAKERREDFDAMWRAIDLRYAYFDAASRSEWKRGRGAWRARAAAASSREAFVAVLEGALATLHDDHVRLTPATPRSSRRVPQDTDIWASWRDGRTVIEAVRYAGDADYVGVRPGETVATVDGVPIARAIDRLLARPGESRAAARDWALRHVLAGPVAGTMALELGGDPPRRIEIERGKSPGNSRSAPAMMSNLIGDDRDLAYLRWKHVGPQDLPGVDAALDAARGRNGQKAARAILLDLRGTQIESRAVTLAILSRFALREGPWQIREGRNGKRDADRVTPVNGRAPLPPLVVLVDRWTAGEAEALAAGLFAVASARLVGTPMAGLRGELHEARLPRSGFEIHFPGEKTFMPDGTPRESLRPHVEVDLAAPNGGPGDPILYQALKLGSDSHYTNSGSAPAKAEFR